jgi:hypothetical protein
MQNAERLTQNLRLAGFRVGRLALSVLQAYYYAPDVFKMYDYIIPGL